MTAISLEQWPDRLNGAIAESAARGALLRRAVVLREVDSTQDAALRLHARPGDVIVAWEQTRGRGRLGRPWSSGAERAEGAAVTFVLPAGPSERLSLLAGIAAAETVERHLGRPVGIKWPNDVIIDGKKVAGVLVEQDRTIARVGIGINVTQREWPPELQPIAISLAQAGAAAADRLEVLEALIDAMARAWNAPDDGLKEAFGRRDLLTGATATLLHDGVEHQGRIVNIDPMAGLTIDTHAGRRVLPAATATVVRVDAAGFRRG